MAWLEERVFLLREALLRCRWTKEAVIDTHAKRNSTLVARHITTPSECNDHQRTNPCRNRFMKTGFMMGVNLLDDHPVVEPHHEGLFELNVRDALPTG